MKKIAPKLLHSFLVQWRAYYRSKPELEYDPDWLWEMFKLYYRFCTMVLGPTHDLIQHTERQWVGYSVMVKKPESMAHQSRRSGKTLKFSHILVFFCELEFGPCHGKCVYRAPHKNQLKGLRQWLRQNPFYVKSRPGDYEVDLFEGPYPLDVACISSGTNTGLECSVLCEDEYSTIKKEEVLYDWMMDTRAFLAKGPTISKRHIHGSSGRRNSPFYDDYLYLMKTDPSAYFCMPYKECWWITEEYIEKERVKNFDAPYWIQEQFECLWVTAAGNFFDQSRLHVLGEGGCPADLFTTLNTIPRLGGLDWNGDIVGHLLGIGMFDGSTLFLMDEIRFSTVPEVNEWIKAHPTIDVEVEGVPKTMGFNAGFSDHLQTLGAVCSYQNWIDSAESTISVKDKRLAILQRADVYASPKCRFFIKNYIEATYDSKQLVPKLLKTPDQHGLDYTLHLMHFGGRLDIMIPGHVEPRETIDSMLDIARYRSRI